MTIGHPADRQRPDLFSSFLLQGGPTVQYLLLIYEDEATFSSMAEGARKDVLDGYRRFTEDLKASGAMLGGEALVGSAAARTVRTRAGRTTVTDGPFAETKEQLGGFYLIDVPTLEEAERWAARIPTAGTGSIEVRAVQKYS
jgi:hypothetical protein